MKENKIDRGRGKGIVFAIAILCVLAVGAKYGYDRLKEVYNDQCVIRDLPAQVEISAGKMVHPSTIAEELGLRAGKNLAEIDFAEKREAILAKIPNLRSIRISRKLPDKVIVTTEERTPVARMGIRGQRGTDGRVVDTDGMVFIWQRGTQSLPVIRESAPPGTQKGHHITGRTLAALRLIEACHEPEFIELNILEIDTSKHDFLVATLGNYSRVKILWNEMDEGTPNSRKDLEARLTNLRDAIRAKVSPETVIWNATIPNRIFADTQGKL